MQPKTALDVAADLSARRRQNSLHANLKAQRSPIPTVERAGSRIVMEPPKFQRDKVTSDVLLRYHTAPTWIMSHAALRSTAVSASDIRHDVDLLIRESSANGSSRQPVEVGENIWTSLLRLTTTKGTLSELRSLYDWKVATKAGLAITDFMALCSEHVWPRADVEGFLTLVRDLLRVFHDRNGPPLWYAQVQAKVLYQALAWAEGRTPDELAGALVGRKNIRSCGRLWLDLASMVNEPLIRSDLRLAVSITTLTLRYGDSSRYEPYMGFVFQRAVKEHDLVSCLALMNAAGKIPSDRFSKALTEHAQSLPVSHNAAWVCDLTAPSRALETLGLRCAKDVAGNLYPWALERRDVFLCAKLLRTYHCKDTHFDHNLAYCEQFLVLCSELQAFEVILDVFVMPGCLGVPLRRLGQDAKQIVATACTKASNKTSNVSKAFKTCYRDLPPSIQAHTSLAWTRLGVETTWRATRNVDQTQNLLHHGLSWATSVGNTALQSALQILALEIYISANIFGKALVSLRRIHHDTVLDSRPLSLAMLLFAKQGHWVTVQRFINLAWSDGIPFTDSETATKINHVIHLYAKSHTAPETWTFVTAVVGDLSFRPNRATNDILLQGFVERQQLHLIPAWLRYLEILGLPFKLDSRVAAVMLGQLYRDTRPSHVVVMWLCRTLKRSAPALAGPELIDLVKEAIGYDLRIMPSRKTSLSAAAHARLQLIEDGTGSIPAPGWVIAGK